MGWRNEVTVASTVIVIGPNGARVTIQSSVSGAQILLAAAGLPANWTPAEIVQQGPALLTLQSGAEGSGDTALNMVLKSTAQSNPAGLPTIAINGAIVVDLDWTNVTPPTGFTGLLRYRLRAENDVEVEAQLAVAATVTAGAVTLISGLTAAYTPTNTQRGPCGVFLNGAPASLAAVQGIMDLRWSANPAGTFTLQAFPGGASGTGVTECSFNIRYALD